MTLDRGHTTATIHWNWHSVVTGNQQVYIPTFFALRRNWFSQLHFYFSHQSTLTESLTVNLTFWKLINWFRAYLFLKYRENTSITVWVNLFKKRQKWKQCPAKRGLLTYGLNGLRKRDASPAYAPVGVRRPLPHINVQKVREGDKHDKCNKTRWL